MKYLCLIYNEEKKLHLMARDELEVLAGECRSFGDTLKKNGQLIACERLQSVNAATTIRIRDGKVAVTTQAELQNIYRIVGIHIAA